MHMPAEALRTRPKQQSEPKLGPTAKGPVNGRVVHGRHTILRWISEIPNRRQWNEELENNHEFMVDLMTKWVGRLNSDEFGAKAKLKQPVTCTTCHASDPRQGN
jgi:hypothetical protein